VRRVRELGAAANYCQRKPAQRLRDPKTATQPLHACLSECRTHRRRCEPIELERPLL